ncbi:hypothetical protein GTY73_18390 [Streptomyces sp. SID8354]|nr:hypothetical protein [Streptomyces sp. SID8354]
MAAAAMTLGSAAGAHAADVPKTPDLGGLSNVDSGSLGSAADGAVQQVTHVAGGAQGAVVDEVVPAASNAVGGAAATVTPKAAETAGTAAGTTGELLGAASQAGTAEGGLLGGLPTEGLSGHGKGKGQGLTDALPGKALTDAASGDTLGGALPTKGLPSTKQLPVKGLAGLA